MTNEEILAAAKEAGCNVSEVESGWVTYRDEPVGNMLERFATIIEKIIEKRTIERCAEYVNEVCTYGDTHLLVKAIRKLGEQ